MNWSHSGSVHAWTFMVCVNWALGIWVRRTYWEMFSMPSVSIYRAIGLVFYYGIMWVQSTSVHVLINLFFFIFYSLFLCLPAVVTHHWECRFEVISVYFSLAAVYLLKVGLLSSVAEQKPLHFTDSSHGYGGVERHNIRLLSVQFLWYLWNATWESRSEAQPA